MPHCIIEYSNDLENSITPIELINKVYKATFKSNLFEENDIKIRAIAYKHYQTGNKKISFIHITIRILSGRDKELKKLLSNLVLNEFENIGIKPLSITVEISEIENETYSKLVF